MDPGALAPAPRPRRGTEGPPSTHQALVSPAAPSQALVSFPRAPSQRPRGPGGRWGAVSGSPSLETGVPSSRGPVPQPEPGGAPGRAARRAHPLPQEFCRRHLSPPPSCHAECVGVGPFLMTDTPDKTREKKENPLILLLFFLRGLMLKGNYGSNQIIANCTIT